MRCRPARLSLIASLALAAACQREGPPRISADSTAYYREQAANLAIASAQKDSLMVELSEATRLITEVSTELTTIRPARPTAPVVEGEGARSDARAELVAQVKELTTRVRDNEQRLGAARRRIEALSGTNDSLRTALAAYTNTITELEGLVASQKTSIEALNQQVAALTGQVTTLTEERRVLTDTVSVMTTRENEVYYVVGTKQELLAKGVITQEGGTRLLLVTRVGESLVPARVLDPGQFTRADKRTLTEIAMPRPDKRYRIVSRHDLAHAEAVALEKGKFREVLRITAPQPFWSVSKYLIIVED